MDHDRLFKELIATFFFEFIELFLPEMAAYLDRQAEVVALDKELFIDVTSGDRREVDLLMKVKFRGQDAYFIVHIENQSTAQSDFPQRMFHYFARLHEKYDLPIYPVVIFSHERPLREEPNQYTVAFPDRSVLEFHYSSIQLNRLSWRQFVDTPNPAACALMSRMKMSVADRPRVKLECLRILATLKLDSARATLIGGFIESYLNLTAQELKRFERTLTTLAPEEKAEAMEVLTYWEKKGREEGKFEGRQLGKEELVVRMLRRRFNTLPTQTEKRLESLTSEQLDDLGEALLDFSSPAEVDAWLLRIVDGLN